MVSAPAKLAVLGATGSVGRSTLAVAAAHPGRIAVYALAANANAAGMIELARRHRPAAVAMADAAAAATVRAALKADGLATAVTAGAAAVADIAADDGTDTVMCALVGAAGLQSTVAAVRAGKKILLANKEPMVMFGAGIRRAAQKSGAVIVPVDSEHNAVFQCWPAEESGAGVARIILTASGGPLRTAGPAELARVTPEDACRHPNWSMGRKVSVDSATMMNKGLEIIEASHLFRLPVARVEVLVHPQSIVHALVEFRDGSLLAHLAEPDMRVPIAHALAWPARMESGARRLTVEALAGLEFSLPDPARFPALTVAREVAEAGGAMPAVLNAANEVAVAAFLARRIAFTAIVPLVRAVVETVAPACQTADVDDVADALAADAEARRCATALLKEAAVGGALKRTAKTVTHV